MSRKKEREKLLEYMYYAFLICWFWKFVRNRDDLFASQVTLRNLGLSHHRSLSYERSLVRLTSFSFLLSLADASSWHLRRVSLRSFARTFAFQFAFTLLALDKGWIMYSPTSEQTSMQPEWQISLPSEPGHESTSASTLPSLPPLLVYLLKDPEFLRDVPRSRMNPDGTRQRSSILLISSEIPPLLRNFQINYRIPTRKFPVT